MSRFFQAHSRSRNSSNKSAIRAIRQFSSATLSVILAFFILLVLFNNLPLWTDRLNGTSYAPTLYASIIAAAAILGIINYRVTFSFVKLQYFLWSAGFVSLLAITAARLSYFEFPVDDLAKSIDQVERAILIPAIAYIVYVTPRKYFNALLPLVACIVPSAIVIEFFFPELFFGVEKNVADAIRVSGFWGNQNAAAEAVILALVMANKNVGRTTLMLLYSLCFIAVVLTGSRAGMFAAAVVGVTFLMQRRMPLYYLVVPIAIALSFSSVILLVENVAEQTGRNRGVDDMVNRISFFTDNENIVEDFSTESRKDVAIEGFSAALKRPILGHGYQYLDPVHRVGPHNVLIDLFHKLGIVGLVAWFLLGYLLFRHADHNRWMNLSLFCFVWFSMFNHNLLGYMWWYIFLAITLVPEKKETVYNNTVFKTHSKRRKKRKKSPSRKNQGNDIRL